MKAVSRSESANISEKKVSGRKHSGNRQIETRIYRNASYNCLVTRDKTAVLARYIGCVEVRRIFTMTFALRVCTLRLFSEVLAFRGLLETAASFDIVFNEPRLQSFPQFLLQRRGERIRERQHRFIQLTGAIKIHRPSHRGTACSALLALGSSEPHFGSRSIIFVSSLRDKRRYGGRWPRTSGNCELLSRWFALRN